MMNIQKSANASRWMRTALLAALAAVATTGCNNNEMPEAGNNPGKQNGKMTIHVATGEKALGTRVAYDDNKVGTDQGNALTWQTGDRLAVVLTYKGRYVAHENDYLYQGADGDSFGSFEGTEIGMTGGSWAVYYPHTVNINTDDGTATLPMTGQTQTADGSTAHLKNYMPLAATGLTGLADGFALEMKSSIMKFDLKSVPPEVGELKELIWMAETAAGTRSIKLKFTPGAVNFGTNGSNSDGTLTAYLSFMPEEMTVKQGGKFSVILTGDKIYRAVTTVVDGKIYEAGKRYTAEVEQSGINWQETAIMALTVKVDEQYPKFNIPFPQDDSTTPANITVEWGDGSTSTVPKDTPLNDNDDFNHTYTKAGTYTIIITSEQVDEKQKQIPDFRVSNRYYSSSLISIDFPLLNTGGTDFSNCFKNCNGLQSIPEGLFDNNTEVTDFSNCFNSCTSLKNIPEGLFDKHTKVTDFSHCFNSCTSLKNIPEGLFDKHTKVTNFNSCFSNCQALLSIPKGLFNNNREVTDFAFCFDQCYALQSIPKGLFDNNMVVTDFGYCFRNCTALQSIPEGLFNYNTKVTRLRACFQDCISLQSIPKGLFDNNKEVTSFTFCFSGCKALQSIPEGLFNKNTKVTDFIFCFGGTALQSIPEGLFDENRVVTSFQDCFSDCTALQSIPKGLFDNNTEVTSFVSCFNGCTALQSIPKGLFNNNREVTDFSRCFFNCTALQSIPEGLFDNNTKVTYFTNCFRNCTALQSIPEGLFDYNKVVTDFQSCFNDCTALQSIPKGLFDKNMGVTDFSYCFQDCTALQSIPEGLFDYNTIATSFGNCFNNCTALQSIPEGLFDKNTGATNFISCFQDCTQLVLHKKIFSINEDLNRFAGKGMYFSQCFKNVGSKLEPNMAGEAPDLWNYKSNGRYWRTDNCFKGTNNLNNWNDIPTDWGGPKTTN